MNFVSVTDKEGQLLPYARHLIDAVAFYKGDRESAEQAKMLLQSEFERWARLGDDAYAPTDLVQQNLTWLSKRSEAVYVAGLLGLALVGLVSEKKRPSLETARNLVASYANRAYKTEFIFWKQDRKGFEKVMKHVASSERAVRRISDEYKSVLHICAARLTANEYLEPTKPFNFQPEADRCYLATVVGFQAVLSKYDIVQRDKRSEPFNLCHVGWKTGFKTDAPPLYPTNELMTALLGTG